MMSRACHSGRCGRRGVVLPMMLLMLVLLGIMAASASFYVHANLSATESLAVRQRARMAAEAGLQKVMYVLRTQRDNVDFWYDNPEEFHRVIVWAEGANEETYGTTQEFEEPTTAYRFSIVADNPDNDEKLVRYGITDEASKLNINVATRDQLVRLIGRFTTEEDNVDELADALIDWRDDDTAVSPFGAENEYYSKLEPAYAVKNKPFDTEEELLLVRGFNGALLYGEDYDRNGLMSPNEDDGDERFPPDDGDGFLKRGLLPYITVQSREPNTASDNRPRVFILGSSAQVRQQLSEFVEDQAKLDFIAGAASAQPPLKSPADLLKDREPASQSGNANGGGQGNGGGLGGGGETGGGNAGRGRGGAPAGQEGGDPGNAAQQGDPGQIVPSPITLEDMVWVMDRCTTTPEPELVGRINVNTATREVLSTLPALSPDDIEAIIQMRPELAPEMKQSAGWVAAIVGAEKFVSIGPYITARATRFHVESLGYGDHMGTIVRLEAVIEMRGPISQIVYNRDITNLGTSFPIRFAVGDDELAGFDR